MNGEILDKENITGGRQKHIEVKEENSQGQRHNGSAEQRPPPTRASHNAVVVLHQRGSAPTPQTPKEGEKGNHETM